MLPIRPIRPVAPDQSTRPAPAGGFVPTVVAAACVVLALLPLLAQADTGNVTRARIDMQYGVEHGSYQDRIDGRTALTQLPWLLRYQQGRMTLQAQLAWVSWRRRDTTDAAAAASGELNAASGWGDAWYKASWELQEVDIDRTGYDLTLKVKGANGDAGRSLGSGRRDVALQVEAMRGWGRTTVFGHAGLRGAGSASRVGASSSAAAADTGTAQGTRRRAYGEIGLQHPGPAGWVSGAFYDYQQPAGSLGPLSELTAFTALTTGATRWELHAARGFNQASARFQVGLSVRNRF
jgi:hypothetical protein